MLNSEKMLFALNDVEDDYLESARSMLGYKTDGARNHIVKKRIVTFALAAALILGLGAVAYAADFFGIRAMLMKDAAPSGEPNDGIVSYTQPQAVPEGMNAAIEKKIENSTNAWAEWDVWRKSNGVFQPEVFQWPEGCVSDSYLDNGDGTWTVVFYAPITTRYDESGNLLGYYDGFREIERRTATQTEYDQNAAYKKAVLYEAGAYNYDFNYQVFSREMGDKLESIAASYGLKLRHNRKVMYQNYGDSTEYATREEITAKINEICAGGKSFFRTEPTGYDKFYYFDEGTFAVNFFTSKDLDNTGESCYLYNSPYGTLSSGFEIFDVVKDVNAFSSRSHTTPDGTELTVLQNGTDIFAYVYLENSFVTLNIKQSEGVSEAEIDAILDMVDFSVIG